MNANLRSIHLKNFRCFKSVEFDLDGSLILIHGLNGSGKTSLLEALHYLGYLRSFRTRTPRELIRFGQDTFFIKAQCNDDEVTIGCSSSKRHVKINKKSVSSFNELWEFHRIVTVTEDDLEVVKGAPEKRRSFIDGSLALQDAQHSKHLKTYRHILDNRNALLQKHTINDEELLIWTKKLWEVGSVVRESRKSFLENLATTCMDLSKTHFNKPYKFEFTYKPKGDPKESGWQAFQDHWKSELLSQEMRYRRTLFGAHLDDITILFQDKPARIFSSRGQQKLIVMLLKMSFVHTLSKQNMGLSFLIDDFLTDFDDQVMKQVIKASLELKVQLIFTSPIEESNDTLVLRSYGAKEIILSI